MAAVGGGEPVGFRRSSGRASSARACTNRSAGCVRRVHLAPLRRAERMWKKSVPPVGEPHRGCPVNIFDCTCGLPAHSSQSVPCRCKVQYWIPEAVQLQSTSFLGVALPQRTRSFPSRSTLCSHADVSIGDPVGLTRGDTLQLCCMPESLASRQLAVFCTVHNILCRFLR